MSNHVSKCFWRAPFFSAVFANVFPQVPIYCSIIYRKTLYLMVKTCKNHSFLHFPHGFPHDFRSTGRLRQSFRTSRCAPLRCKRNCWAMPSPEPGEGSRCPGSAWGYNAWMLKDEIPGKLPEKPRGKAWKTGSTWEKIWKIEGETGKPLFLLMSFWVFLGLDVEICWMTSCFREICVSTFVRISGSSDLFPLNSPTLDKYLPTVSQSLVI